MFDRGLRRIVLAARGWFLRRRTRELFLPVGAAAEHLGSDLLAALFRCSVSANRALSAMDLLHLNYRARAEGEPSFDRNKSALSAWAAAEMREAGHAVMELRRQGARQRLTVADAAWRRLVESAQRWCDKESRYRIFREKFAAHRDQAAVKLAIADLSEENIVFARLAGPQAKHQYYPGADNIAFHGWRLHAGVEDADLPEFAETMERDVLNFAREFEQVALDLLGQLSESSSLKHATNTAP